MLKRLFAAAFLTVTLLVVVSLVGNWTNAIDGEFIALGQTTENPPDSSITLIIPQVASGSFDNGVTEFNTIIQVINSGSSDVSLSAEFFNQDGTPSTLSFVTITGGQDTSTGGSTFESSVSSVSVPANDSLIIASLTRVPTATRRWSVL